MIQIDLAFLTSNNEIKYDLVEKYHIGSILVGGDDCANDSDIIGDCPYNKLYL